MRPGDVASVPRLSLSRAELAQAIGVSPNSIDEMVREGLLPRARRWHTRKLWITAEVAAYISEWPVDGATGEVAAPDQGEDDWRASA
ncbi:hypothetical protein [Aureimonas leprariae]|uniref:Helix-turn-helix domain-containing protein n=1 Tax=Plantimonas leprariae TaxID=2615207 RepID=A0A7V7TY62_9HYPH|nr:hypothetical protein [Aureimonas leprariae]KAB0682030.1 hypothetical protein F6X38_04295 [Aureimonas leprariae]